MIKELQTIEFHLQPCGIIYVYNYILANKLNKYLKQYENGAYKFLPGEEAKFLLPQIEYTYILNAFLLPTLPQIEEAV